MASLKTILQKKKVAELQVLADKLGFDLSDVKGKAKIIDFILERKDEVLSSMKLGDLKKLAKELSIDVGGLKKKADVIEEIDENLTPDMLEALFPKTGEPDASDDPSLEELGEEIADIGKDLEDVVEKVERMPSADMYDIVEIDEDLDNATQRDVDYTIVGQKLDMGRMKFSDKNYIQSLNELKEARDLFHNFEEDYENVINAYLILSSEKILENCKDSSLNDENAADLLIDAKRAFREKGARRAEATDKLIILAIQIYDDEISIIRKLMDDLENSVNAMKIQGVDVFNAERYIHRAEEAFENGELALTNTCLDKGRNSAQESKNDWTERIKADVPRVEQIINMANDLGASVSEAEKFMNQAKLALDNEDYALCAELTKVSERKAMESQQSQIQKAAQLERRQLAEAQDILSKITPIIEEATLYQLDIQNVHNVIQSARNALQSNDYVNAKIYAREAENLIRSLGPQLEAERQKILDTEPDLRVCVTCNNPAVKIFDTGDARCMSCGAMFKAKPSGSKRKQDKKKWGGIFK